VEGEMLKVTKVTGLPNDTLVMPVGMEEHDPAVAEERPTATGSQTQGLEDTQLPRAARAPQDPHPAEKKLHALTHLTHRDWCDVCVKARGRDEAHQHAEDIVQITERIDGLEVVQMDYTFMEDLKILSIYALAQRG
jgi:hypothetical protein